MTILPLLVVVAPLIATCFGILAVYARQPVIIYILGAAGLASWLLSLGAVFFDPWLGLTLACLVIVAGFNLGRLWQHRYHRRQLQKRIIFDSMLLLLLADLAFFLRYVVEIDLVAILGWLATTLLMIAAIQLVLVVLNLRQSSYQVGQRTTEARLPSVTLAIPARNEDHALEACLEAVVASDYPKLEIVVLDDCSQDATPQLIKRFAQAGVRFVQGIEPATGWLGKNRAYQTLAEEASGDYIAFLSVDTRIAPNTIRQAMQYMLGSGERPVEMLSVLPRRRHKSNLTSLIQPLGNFWNFALPHLLAPPIADSFWVIRRRTLFSLGSFKAVQAMVRPERYFARELHQNGSYRFQPGSPELAVETTKRLTSVYDTALRQRYPSQRRSVVVAMLVAICLVATLMCVVIAVILLLLGLNPIGATNVLLAALLVFVGYGAVLRVTTTSWQKTLLGTVALPIAALFEAVVVVSSMWAYEYGEINWKGRNICLIAQRSL